MGIRPTVTMRPARAGQKWMIRMSRPITTRICRAGVWAEAQQGLKQQQAMESQQSPVQLMACITVRHSSIAEQD